MRPTSLLLASLGCAACNSPSAPPALASASASALASASAPPSARASASAPAPAAFAIENLGAGEFAIESPVPVKLATVARIEQKSGGDWKLLEHLDLNSGYRLVERCADTPPACIDLLATTPLHPVPFRGFNCSAQCNDTCAANVWLGPGTFRLVVSTCDGAAVAGPPFELPPVDNSSLLERWGLAADAVSAAAMRLEKPGAGWNGASPAAPDRIAGFTVRAGTERPLDAATLAALLDRLRAPAGYDDRIAKRCAMDHLVGFRLTRRPASTGAAHDDIVEIAVDFTCQKLFAARGGSRGRARSVLGTHFDPSRAAFLALVKQALPGDAEIARLP